MGVFVTSSQRCCLFALVAARRELVFPPRSDWPLVVVSGALQMAAYSALTGLALTVLPPGRASVWPFRRQSGSSRSRDGGFMSTFRGGPCWALALGLWACWRSLSPRFIRTGRSGLGVRHADGCGCRMGDFDRLRALASLHSVRSCAGPLADTYRSGVAFPLAILVEGSPPTIGKSGVASLAYVGPIATAFAYWAVVEAGRHFRASTMSVTLLAPRVSAS